MKGTAFVQYTQKLSLKLTQRLRVVPTIVTAIRSAHLEILGLPMGGAYNTGIFLRG